MYAIQSSPMIAIGSKILSQDESDAQKFLVNLIKGLLLGAAYCSGAQAMEACSYIAKIGKDVDGTRWAIESINKEFLKRPKGKEEWIALLEKMDYLLVTHLKKKQQLQKKSVVDHSVHTLGISLHCLGIFLGPGFAALGIGLSANALLGRFFRKIAVEDLTQEEKEVEEELVNLSQQVYRAQAKAISDATQDKKALQAFEAVSSQHAADRRKVLEQQGKKMGNSNRGVLQSFRSFRMISLLVGGVSTGVFGVKLVAHLGVQMHPTTRCALAAATALVNGVWGLANLTADS